MRVTIVKVHLILAVGFIGAGCGGDSRSGDAFTDAKRVTRLTPVGWIDSSDRLVLVRVDQLVREDVGQVACDSTGMAEWSGGDAGLVRVFDKNVCDWLWHGEAFSRSADGALLIYSTPFEPGVRFLVDLERQTRSPLSAECTPTSVPVSIGGISGRVASVASCNGVHVLHVDGAAGGRSKRLTFRTDGRVTQASWSPDENDLLFVVNLPGEANEVRTISIESGEQRKVAVGAAAAWARDGKAVAVLQTEDSTDLRVLRFPRQNEAIADTLWEASADVAPRPSHNLSPLLLWSNSERALAVNVHGKLWYVTLTEVRPPGL
jgi:hypothetical protein